MPGENEGGVKIYELRKRKPKGPEKDKELKKEADQPGSTERENEELDTDHLIAMAEFLKELLRATPGLLKRETIDMREELVAGASNEELIAWVNNSSQADWQKSPTFYIAVVDEIRKRARPT